MAKDLLYNPSKRIDRAQRLCAMEGRLKRRMCRKHSGGDGANIGRTVDYRPCLYSHSRKVCFTVKSFKLAQLFWNWPVTNTGLRSTDVHVEWGNTCSNHLGPIQHDAISRSLKLMYASFLFKQHLRICFAIHSTIRTRLPIPQNPYFFSQTHGKYPYNIRLLSYPHFHPGEFLTQHLSRLPPSTASNYMVYVHTTPTLCILRARLHFFFLNIISSQIHITTAFKLLFRPCVPTLAHNFGYLPAWMLDSLFAFILYRHH